MIVLASLLILIYIIFIGLTLGEIYKGNSAYLLLYIICFLPFYTVFQITVFNAFENNKIIIPKLRSYKLEDANLAHDLLESRQGGGSIFLTP